MNGTVNGYRIWACTWFLSAVICLNFHNLIAAIMLGAATLYMEYMARKANKDNQ